MMTSDEQKQRIKDIIDLLERARQLPLAYVFLKTSPGKQAQNWLNGFNYGIQMLEPDLYEYRSGDKPYKETLAERGWSWPRDFWWRMEALTPLEAIDLLLLLEIEVWKRIKSLRWRLEIDEIIRGLEGIRFRPGIYMGSTEPHDRGVLMPASVWLAGLNMAIWYFAYDLNEIEIESVYKDIFATQGESWPSNNTSEVMCERLSTELEAVQHLFAIEIEQWKRRLAKLKSTNNFVEQ